MRHLRGSRRHGKREHGQILVLFELVMIMILGFAAMVVDLGVLRNNRQILVNTLDAAALTGGSKLPVNGPTEAVAARDAIVHNIDVNYHGLVLGTDYTITYKCLIGADPVTGAPLISRDVRGVCDPHNALHHDPPVASDFTGAGKTRVSDCDPTAGDKCNVVVITGSSTTNYALAPVLGVSSGSTGTVVSAACKGACGAATVVPVDLVIILDRTMSMSWTSGGYTGAQKIAALQSAAKAVLKVYDPAKQRVALALTGPGKTTSAGLPNTGTCDAGGGGTVYGTADNNNWVAETSSTQAMGTTTLRATTSTNPTTTTLNGNINNSTTTVKVNSAAGFPASGNGDYTILVDSEQMVVRAGEGTTTWTSVLRGQNGTARVAHNNGATVSLIVNTTTLNGNITNSALTFAVKSATGFPTTGNYTILVDNEQMVVRGGQGTVNWTSVLRGQNLTTAATHANGATVSLLVGTTDPILRVTSATGFPNSGSYVITVDSERMLVTAGAGTTSWTVTRGYNSTDAASHDGGSLVTPAVVRVASAAEFPSSGVFTITIDSELMQVIGGQGTTSWTVTRGYKGSPIATHSSGASVSRQDLVVSQDIVTNGPTSYGAWVPVGLSGTDSDSPAASPNGILGKYSSGGVPQTASTIVQSINCIDAASDATDLATPIAMARWYLDTYGRKDVAQGIILETDGHPQYGFGGNSQASTNESWTCQAAVQAASDAKLDTTNSPDGIRIFTVGYGVDDTIYCPTYTSNWAADIGTYNMYESTTGGPTGAGWSGEHATTLLATIATSLADYYPNPSPATIESVFQQAATSLAKGGAHLISLYPQPVVTGVSSSSVSGMYFTGATSVTFGGMPAARGTVTDISISITLPAGLTHDQTYDVIVTTPGGSSVVLGSSQRYYYP